MADSIGNQPDRFADYDDAFAFLDGHPAFQYKGRSHFLLCYRVREEMVNPNTKMIDKDENKNTEKRIVIDECGPWSAPDTLIPAVRKIYPDGMCTHDYNLNCSAPTWQEVIKKLARLVLDHCGDYASEPPREERNLAKDMLSDKLNDRQ